MFNKWEQLDLLHDMFDTPAVSRIANRVVINRYNQEGQRFILSLDANNDTLLLPVQSGVPTTMLPVNARAYFSIKLKGDRITCTEIKFEYAKELVSKCPELDVNDIGGSVEDALKNSFMSNTLPKINYRDPANWPDFLRVFKKQNNDVMQFFVAMAICKFEEMFA